MASDDKQSLPADIEAAIEAIRDDREHGASWLARAAAQTLQRAGEPREDVAPEAWETMMLAAARMLAASRPSMAAVANVAARIWSADQAAPPTERQQAMGERAARLAIQDEQTNQMLIAHAEKALAGVVYTLSRSSSVEETLRALGRRHIVTRALIAESRPGGEGVALGRALADGGLPVTLVADAACGVFIGEATCVALGADSVRADGSVVNKVGSYPLALTARAAGKPVYVLCETLKIAAPDFPLVLEEKDAPEALPVALVGMSVRNPYFDVTPAPLIAAYITEQGILDREAIADMALEAGVALARLRDG